MGRKKMKTNTGSIDHVKSSSHEGDIKAREAV